MNKREYKKLQKKDGFKIYRNYRMHTIYLNINDYYERYSVWKLIMDFDAITMVCIKDSKRKNLKHPISVYLFKDGRPVVKCYMDRIRDVARNESCEDIPFNTIETLTLMVPEGSNDFVEVWVY